MKKGLNVVFISAVAVAIITLLALVSAFSSMSDVPRLKDPEKVYSELEGKGTYSEPYLIETARDLVYFSESVNAGNSYEGKYVVQTADLDMSGVWIRPIGIHNTEKYFLGTYDGMGYAINDLCIEGGFGPDAIANNAMFGFLGGRVQNVRLVGGRISGACCAAIASHGGGDNSYIINCYSSTVVDGFRSGGIVDNYNGFVYGCVFEGEADAFCSYTCRGLEGNYSAIPMTNEETFKGISEDNTEFTIFGDAEIADLNENIDEFWRTNKYRPFSRWSYSDGAAVMEPIRAEKSFGQLMAELVIPLLCVFAASVVTAVVTGHKASAVERLVWAARKAKPLHLYLLVASAISIFSLIFISEHKDVIYDYLVGYFGADIYADFFNHIDYCKNLENVYYQAPFACFPPLAYVAFYYPLGLLLSEDAVIRYDPWANASEAFMVYTVSVIICCIVIFWFAKCFLDKFGMGKVSWVSALILISNTFLFGAIERGNSVTIVLALMMATMWLRERESKVSREIALILIAVAAGFKIYPALFGLIYIAEKRWKEAIRLVIYGVLFFFVPFAFCGGWDGFVQFLKVLTQVQTDAYSSLTSITATVALLAEKTELAFFAWKHAATLLTAVFLVINLVALFSKRLDLWERAMIICCICVLAPAWSGTYTCIYFAVPMIMFFAHTQDGFGKRGKLAYNLICAAGFALIFSLISFVSPGGFAFCDVRYVAIMLIDALIVVKGILSLIKRKRTAEFSR